MGNCCMGTEPQSPRVKSNSYGGGDYIDDEVKEKEKKSTKVSLQKTETCKSKKKLPFRVYCEPLLYKNQIIFLSGDLIRNKEEGMRLEAQYLTKYYIKDLYSDEITERKINCDDDTQIDILPTNNACVYTLNPDNDKIYFIVNRRKLMTLDLTTDTIESLNKEISDMEGENNAQIAYLNGKGICVMGPDKITNNEEKDDDYISKIPYNKFMVKSGQESDKEKCKFENYGNQTRVITAKMGDDKKNCILMMGGMKLQKADDSDDEVIAPHDEVFITDGEEYLTFQAGGSSPVVYHTAYPIFAFGIINYKNEYLFQFGGVDTQKPSNKQNSDKPGTRARNDIRVLRISKGDPCDNNYNLDRYKWYSLEMKIPRNGACHAMFNEDGDRIELVTCFGKHYSFSPNELFKQLKNGEQKNEGSDGLTKGWKGLNEWTVQGKTVNPTKSTSIRNIGPAEDSDVDEMLRDLGEPYEDYINSMDEFTEYKEVYDDKNLGKLKGIIKNKEHLETIIAKAKELAK